MTSHSTKEYNDDNPWRHGDVLTELYVREGLTTTEIAERFGITHQAVLYWMDKHEIERREYREYTLRHATYGTDAEGHPCWRYYDRGTEMRIPVHRLLAAAVHGVGALKGKVVHHQNHIPWDNRPDNLAVMDPDEHIAHHSHVYHGRLTGDERWGGPQ